jgi:hypothetical protein
MADIDTEKETLEKNKEDLKDNNKEKSKEKNYNIKIIRILIIDILLIISAICIYHFFVYIEPVTEAGKPIIYLYPEQTTQLTVKLGHPENLTCSYPNYIDGWNIIANPDGSLIDTNSGRNLYSLYWEGIVNENISSLDEGFVVKGEDTIAFLEEKLAILGLNEIEAEEFIVYWLPKMQNNKYNFIKFLTTEEMNKIMPLDFSEEPDSLIRILMAYKPLEKYIDVKEQELSTPARTGFVVVEWGGTEI